MPEHHHATRQFGFAALLMVLVVGLATAALVLARVNHVRSGQEVAAMLKGSTTAHARAWKAADAMRIALGDAATSYVAGLDPGMVLAITMDDRTSYRIDATVVSNQLVDGAQEITLRVQAADAAQLAQTRTTAAVLVTYQVRPTPCDVTRTCPKPPPPSTLVIRGDLDAANATIRFLGEGDTSLYVDGHVNLGGQTYNLSELCATGNITVGGPSEIASVCTDMNLLVKDSASIGTAHAIGSIQMQSRGRLGSAISNASVSVTGGTVEHLQSTGDVLVAEPARVATLRTEGKLQWTSSASADSVETNGDIEAYRGNSDHAALASRGKVTLQGSVKDLLAHGSVALVPDGLGMGVKGMLRANGDFSYVPRQSTVVDGEVGGSINPPLLEPLVPPVNVLQSGKQPVVRLPAVTVPLVGSVLRETFKIDVNFLRSEANYVFTSEDDGKMVVQVKDVSGIPPGKYYLGVHRLDSGALTGVVRLCAQTTLQSVGSAQVPVCTVPALPTAAQALCVSGMPSQPCLAYTPADRTWTFSRAIVPVGAYWLDGNLVLDQSSNVASFLATGNIRVTGYLSVSAPNTVVSSRACAGALLPTNFCDPTSRALRTPSLALGNAALVAGSYEGTVFTGGDIHLETSQEVAGNVLAGNQVLINAGAAGAAQSVVTIHGRMLASGQSGQSVASVLAGKINFVTDDFQSTFDPSVSPCMSSACNVSSTVRASQQAVDQSAAPSAGSAGCTLAAGCTQGRVSQVRVFWAAPD
jgi:hypothetical protein